MNDMRITDIRTALRALPDRRGWFDYKVSAYGDKAVQVHAAEYAGIKAAAAWLEDNGFDVPRDRKGRLDIETGGTRDHPRWKIIAWRT